MRHPRTRYLMAAMAVILAALPQRTAAQQQALSPQDHAAEEYAYTLGVQAYVYGYPVVEMYRTRYGHVFAANATHPGLNRFRHVRDLAGPSSTSVVAPNNDTLYSSAWLDLAQQPVVLDVPDTNGRYYVFQFMDFYTNNFAFVGKRSTGTTPGSFAIVGPNWKGTLPAGVKRIDAPTNAVWLLGRTLVDGRADLDAVRAIQDRCLLTPLTAWRTTAPAVSPGPGTPPPPYDPSDPLKFFEILNAGLTENPPPAREAALMGLFGTIGVSPGKAFKIDQLNPATARGLRRATEEGPKVIQGRSGELSQSTTPGWRVPQANLGAFGDDYPFRAIVAKIGLAALSPEEAMYFHAVADAQGRPLHGSRRYVLRFEKGQVPPVEAFWSLTMYRRPGRFLVDNPINRYSIGDRTPGVRSLPDGALEIYVQRESPGKDREANWLPAPEGDFDIALRCYLPRKAIRDGVWKLPVVQAIE